MVVVVCPSCRKKFRPPDYLVGRRVRCPKCDKVFSNEDIAVLERAPPSAEAEERLPTSARLGMIALFLGVGSILLLCLPSIGGYLSLGLSGVGLLLALGGLLRVQIDGDEAMSRTYAGGAGIFGNFGARARDYPLAGVGACVLALVLALLPSLFN